MNGANKLKNGLFKIDETRVKVEAMSTELVEAKKKVEQFQRQCEDYLIVIVQQKREADEQAKVSAVFLIPLIIIVILTSIFFQD